MGFQVPPDPAQPRSYEDVIAHLDVTLLDVVPPAQRGTRWQLDDGDFEVDFRFDQDKRVEVDLGDGRIIEIHFRPAPVTTRPEPLPPDGRTPSSLQETEEMPSAIVRAL